MCCSTDTSVAQILDLAAKSTSRVQCSGVVRACEICSGVGDYEIEDVEGLTDPCPLPGSVGHRTLNDSERRIYAPMTDLDGFVLDRDAVYVEIPDWKVHYSADPDVLDTAGDKMIRSLKSMDTTIDEQLKERDDTLFAARLNNRIMGEASSEEDEPETHLSKKETALPQYETVQDSGRTRKRVLFEHKLTEPEQNELEDDVSEANAASDWSDDMNETGRDALVVEF